MERVPKKMRRRATPALVEAVHVGRCAVLRPRRPVLGEGLVGALQQGIEQRASQHAVSSVAITGADQCLLGSDLDALQRALPVDRGKFFQSIANLCRSLSESPVPVAAVLDGNLSGCALGIAAHARFCVVTERTRLMLPGPEFGFVPESFAAFHLARLPAGLGGPCLSQ